MTDLPRNYHEILADIAVRKGEDIESIVRFLRDAGLDVMGSIKALKDAKILNRGEAKLAVFNSPTWADAMDGQKKFHSGLMEDLEQDGLVDHDRS